jgi:tetratricopeptide (TPR) repeat protein/serine/threonine protein kinase
MLQVYRQVGSFLEPPADGLWDEGEPKTDWISEATADGPGETPGAIIGPYKLSRPIGQGGMGVVWLAEQEQPVRRMVALKVIRAGLASRQAIARFEVERQALALMDHVNIARVFDGGTTECGRPYFVMELIRGIPITQYCEDNHLTLRERLELFLSACRAIQHAHQKGIIHRDIKPSNVLVAVHDAKPVPKVIDFGVAKAIEQPLTDQTLCTQHGSIIGTFEYMSPEQAEPSAVGVDTRSDIYSLGVLLYELLTGTTPLERQRLRTASYSEIVRLIREEEPPKPSTRMIRSQKLSDLAAARKMEPVKLAKLVRGELDWIVMKALEKDRNRRYHTANGLAMDVQRYLNDETVQACPPSAWYRFRKFTRRNKPALAIAGLVLLCIVVVCGGSGWVIRDRGAREAALDSEVDHILDEAGPLMEKGRWSEALAAVERADRLLASAGRKEHFPRLDDLQRDLKMVQRLEDIYRAPNAKQGAEREFYWDRDQDRRFADAFRDFGIDVEGLSSAEAATRIAQSGVGPALVQALDEWAALSKSARGDQDPFWKKLLAIAGEADPDDWRNRFREALRQRDRPELEKLAAAVPIREVPPATAYLLGHALVELGAMDRAMAVLREAHNHHPDDFWLNDALGYFSEHYCQPPRHEDALRYYSVCLALRPHHAGTHLSVAWVLVKKGATDEALARYSKALALFSQMIKLDPKNAKAWKQRSYTYCQLHQYDKALADLNKSIALDPNDAVAWNNRGHTYIELRHYDEAIADLNKAIELDPKYAMAWSNRGRVYNRLHLYDKALADLNKAVALDSKYGYAWNNRGLAYMYLMQYEKALADFNKAIELDPKDGVARSNRGHTYTELRQYDKALADLNKAIELNSKYALAWNNRGRVFNELHDYEKAIADLNTAIKLDPKDARAWNNRGYAYNGLHQYDKALADLNKAIELDSTVAYAWSNRGHIYTELHQYDKALADLNKAIELDPKYALAWNHRGTLHTVLHQYDEAIADFNKAIELEPKNTMAWKIRSFIYIQLHQYDNATADLNKVLKLDPKDAMAWNNRGSICIQLHQYDKAITDLNKAIELDPKYATAWSNRGYSYFQLHQYDKAIADFSTAINLDAKVPQPRNHLAWLLATCSNPSLRDPRRAVELAKEAVELTPTNGTYCNTLGAAHYYAGDWMLAIQTLKKSMELNKGSNGLDYFFLAMASWQWGEKAQARRWYDRAVQWMEKNQPKDEKIQRFRGEAAKLLGLEKKSEKCLKH